MTAADGSAVQVSVQASFVAETKAEGSAALPADDLLARLAADVRLKPENGWTDAPAGETSALSAIGARWTSGSRVFASSRPGTAT